jgi:hypothetical protein
LLWGEAAEADGNDHGAGIPSHSRMASEAADDGRTFGSPPVYAFMSAAGERRHPSVGQGDRF